MNLSVHIDFLVSSHSFGGSGAAKSQSVRTASGAHNVGLGVTGPGEGLVVVGTRVGLIVGLAVGLDVGLIVGLDVGGSG